MFLEAPTLAKSQQKAMSCYCEFSQNTLFRACYWKLAVVTYIFTVVLSISIHFLTSLQLQKKKKKKHACATKPCKEANTFFSSGHIPNCRERELFFFFQCSWLPLQIFCVCDGNAVVMPASTVITACKRERGGKQLNLLEKLGT